MLSPRLPRPLTRAAWSATTLETFYAPAAERARELSQNDHAAAGELASWRRRVQRDWHGVYINAKTVQERPARVGETLSVEAVVHPRDFSKDELRVELVYSPAADGLERNLHTVTLTCAEQGDDGCSYRADFTPAVSGQLAYGVRVYPVHPALVSPFEAHAIRWA